MTGADLLFVESTHEYRRPDGLLVPSVTQILEAVGVSTDWELLRRQGPAMAAAIDRKQEIGRALHLDAHAYDDGDLDLATVHPAVLPYVEAWAVCRANLRLEPLQRERRLYSEALGFCGTVDAICVRNGDHDRLILIDLKTGDVDDAAAQYQTAAYAILWNSEHPDRLIRERWAVELTPDRAVPYRIHNFTATPDHWKDAQYFQAFVVTYYRQAVRRIGR